MCVCVYFYKGMNIFLAALHEEVVEGLGWGQVPLSPVSDPSSGRPRGPRPE